MLHTETSISHSLNKCVLNIYEMPSIVGVYQGFQEHYRVPEELQSSEEEETTQINTYQVVMKCYKKQIK